MTVYYIGTTFPPSSDWYEDENLLILNIKKQIEQSFSGGDNLFINTTWFGPQFNNSLWQEYQQLASKQKFNRLFLLAAADPVFLNTTQIAQLKEDTCASELYLLGHFDGSYYFNFHSQVLTRYFTPYCTNDLIMTAPNFIYLNYNRKPRDHRSDLVNKLTSEKLLSCGIVTLGIKHNIFSKDIVPSQHLTLNESINDAVGNWDMSMEFGIPHDIHSLGKLDLWQQHFLNIVGETEFFPWDNMFISEKTWKPVLGLRPFVINGQTKIYKYLRDQGFKTFNHYWPQVNLEDVAEYEVANSIVQVVKYLKSLDFETVQSMYNDMLPDLLYNKERFFEFANEQQYKMEHLFK